MGKQTHAPCQQRMPKYNKNRNLKEEFSFLERCVISLSSKQGRVRTTSCNRHEYGGYYLFIILPYSIAAICKVNFITLIESKVYTFFTHANKSTTFQLLWEFILF